LVGPIFDVRVVVLPDLTAAPPRTTKKTGAVERPVAFNRAGLLVDGFSGRAGSPLT